MTTIFEQEIAIDLNIEHNINNVIYAGLASISIWFMISIFIKKHNFKNSITSTSIFGILYILGSIIYYYLYNLNYISISKYNISIIGIILWFLFKLIVQKKPIYRILPNK